MSKQEFCAPFEDKTVDLGHGLTLRIEWHTDIDPDLSYLDADNDPEYAEQNAERLESFAVNWDMMGYTASIYLNGKEIDGVDSLWGIESDNSTEYILMLESEVVSMARDNALNFVAHRQQVVGAEFTALQTLRNQLDTERMISAYYGDSDYWWHYDTDKSPVNLEYIEPETDVIFRVWTAEFPEAKQPGTGDLYSTIAIFPAIPTDFEGKYCQMFQHIGQHGGGNYNLVMKGSRPARPEEYADLKRELESAPYHYNLVVRKRRTPEHIEAHRAELANWRSIK